MSTSNNSKVQISEVERRLLKRRSEAGHALVIAIEAVEKYGLTEPKMEGVKRKAEDINKLLFEALAMLLNTRP
jgi:hypothetical protein